MKSTNIKIQNVFRTENIPWVPEVPLSFPLGMKPLLIFFLELWSRFVQNSVQVEPETTILSLLEDVFMYFLTCMCVCLSRSSYDTCMQRSMEVTGGRTPQNCSSKWLGAAQSGNPTRSCVRPASALSHYLFGHLVFFKTCNVLLLIHTGMSSSSLLCITKDTHFNTIQCISHTL